MSRKAAEIWHILGFVLCLVLLLGSDALASEPYVKQAKKDCVECHVAKYYPSGDFFKAETVTKWRYHWWIFSIGFFAFTCGVMAKLYVWSMGRGRVFSKGIERNRFLNFLVFEVVLQRKIFKESYVRWFIFFSESMGFLMLFFFFLILVFTRFVFKIEFFISGAGGLALNFLLDFIGLLILCGTVVSFVRRTVKKKKNLITEREDIVAVLFLFFIVLTGFFLEACKIAVLPVSYETYFSFVGFGMASIMRHFDLPWTAIRFYGWIVHAIIVFLFFAYIPFSKFIHFMTCPVTTLAMSSDPQG